MARTQSRSKRGKPRRSPVSTGIQLGKELALLRAELKDYRMLTRRYARIGLALVFSVVGKASGVPLMESAGRFTSELANVLWYGLT